MRGIGKGTYSTSGETARKRPVLSRWAFRPAAEGEPPGILEINTDITERRKIEEQLRNTQRLGEGA